jgi:hypothetical protein
MDGHDPGIMEKQTCDREAEYANIGSGCGFDLKRTSPLKISMKTEKKEIRHDCHTGWLVGFL